MCGRFTAHYTWEELVELYRLSDDVPARNLEPRYNVAPTQRVAVCRLDGDEQRVIALLRWGLIPFWAKDLKIGYRTINARAETVHEKLSFRHAFQHRRCLVPVNSWYEWKQEDGAKQPYLISLPQTPFSFAGLWERNDKLDEPVESFTIVVGNAAPDIAHVHDREPAIIGPEDYDRWLDPDTSQDDLLALVQSPCPGPFGVRKVSRRVNSPKNDDADLVEAI